MYCMIYRTLQHSISGVYYMVVTHALVECLVITKWVVFLLHNGHICHYYKMGLLLHFGHLRLLQNGSCFITKWAHITKWVGFFYYKMGTYHKMGLNSAHTVKNSQSFENSQIFKQLIQVCTAQLLSKSLK